nr:hypothetical protein [Tanacetum cinerariifolium]
MPKSSSHSPLSSKITPKEEPITLDKPKSPNPFLHLTQVEFTFKEITFTTNNKVALLYPSHPNQEYFKDVSDFISKCCIKEAFTRAPTQYKEYLSEFWYTAKTLEVSKAWVSTLIETKTKSSSAKEKSSSHPLPPTLVVIEMHKEAQQAASGLTSLGATSKQRAHIHLTSGHDALADFTAEADPGLFAPNDSISS